MVSKKIRITGAQLSFPVGAIQQNKQTILDAIEIGEQNQSDIVVFPELALTGYPQRICYLEKVSWERILQF